MSQKRALWKLAIVQARLFLREPIAAFFTLMLAPLLLILMGFIFGNTPAPEFGGQGHLDIYVPSYAAMVIGIVGLAATPIETSTRREVGILRRFRATPLRPLVYIVADVLVYFAMTMLGILLLFLLATFVFQVRFEGNLLTLMAGICLSTATFLALGYVLASLVPNARTVPVVGNILLYLMVILSGATVPLEIMPETVRNASRFIPLTHVVTLLRGLWFGDPFGEHLVEVAVLGVILAVGTVIATWTFRWE